MDPSEIVEFVKNISIYVGLIANLIIVVGAFPVFFWLKNRSFEKRRKEISDNLAIRKNIKEKLREHADGYDRSESHDIGIRLVYWKNYPWKLDDDGYKQNLYYDTNLDKRLYHGTEFLSSTGILVEEHIWFLSRSLYLGEFGTYIVAYSGQHFKGFREIKQRLKLIHALKYKHIINWDFEEKIEYEPVFYTRFKYNSKKLFENEFFAQNTDDDGIAKDLIFVEHLNRRDRVKSPRSLKYKILIVKGNQARKKSVRNMKKRMKNKQ